MAQQNITNKNLQNFGGRPTWKCRCLSILCQVVQSNNNPSVSCRQTRNRTELINAYLFERLIGVIEQLQRNCSRYQGVLLALIRETGRYGSRNIVILSVS